MDLVTNVTYFLWTIRDHPIGRGSHLPGYIAENHEIAPSDRNHNTGRPYQDNLRFFRCLALHKGCHSTNLERDSKHYYEQYREAGLAKKKFHGVKLNELDELEKLYEVNIQVNSLAPTQSHGEDKDDTEEETRPDIAAILFSLHTATRKALYSCSSTRTIFRTLKISPGIVNRFNVPVAASTGKICGNVSVMRRCVTGQCS